MGGCSLLGSHSSSLLPHCFFLLDPPNSSSLVPPHCSTRKNEVAHIKKTVVRSTLYNSSLTSVVGSRNFFRFPFFIFFTSEARICFLRTWPFQKLWMTGQLSNVKKRMVSRLSKRPATLNLGYSSENSDFFNFCPHRIIRNTKWRTTDDVTSISEGSA